MRITLARYNDRGVTAGIEGDDDMDTVVVWKHRGRCNPKEACQKAATRLRAAADRFDELALIEDDPFKCDVQDKLKSC